MKTNILKLVKWFCRKLTYNELASAIVIFHEVLSGSRFDIELKPDEKPPHYRDFRIDMLRPLAEAPEPKSIDSRRTCNASFRKYQPI